MPLFPDLSRYDRFAVDTETTGLTRKDVIVGVSITVPGDQSWYFRWGHERGGNNCSKEEFIAWMKTEFYRPKQIKIFFNSFYDIPKFVHTGLITVDELFPCIEDAGTAAALLNEHENSYTLDRLLNKYLGESKDESFLKEWIVAQFGCAENKWKEYIWRAPGNLVEPYAVGDTLGTLHLYDRNRGLIRTNGLERIYAVETAIIPTVILMNLHGVRVDSTHAREVKEGIEQKLITARARWLEIASDAGVEMPEGWVYPSTAQTVPIFDKHGIPYGRTKPSERFPDGQASITQAVLEASDHDVAVTLMAIRHNEKLRGTFIDNILEMGGEDGIIHSEFHPLMIEYVPGKKYGTVSGRFSAKLVHQIPGDAHEEVGQLIRSIFVPYYEEGQWIKSDYSQIEYRFLAHYAGGVLAEAYNADPKTDFHQMVSDLIGNPDLNRNMIKRVNFGEIYGAGLKKGAQLAGVSIDEWKRIKKIYHEKTGGVIGRLNEQVQLAAARRGYIITWGGRRCRYFSADEARAMGWKVHPKERYVGTYKALNNLLQGSAGDLIKYAMVRVAADLVDWKNVFLHLTVHDELDFTAPKGAAGEKFKKDLNTAMTDWREEDGVPRLNVPIRVEIASGKDWGHVEKEKK